MPTLRPVRLLYERRAHPLDRLVALVEERRDLLGVAVHPEDELRQIVGADGVVVEEGGEVGGQSADPLR